MAEPTRSRLLGAFLLCGALCALLDQLCKSRVVASLAQGERIPYVGGFFELVHVRNPGGAFGLLGGLPQELRVAIFAGIFAIAGLVVLSILRALAPGERGALSWAMALGVLMGGAASNLIDRVHPHRGGDVIDYLHLRPFDGYAWPDFNLGDASIVLALMTVAVQLSAREGEARARQLDEKRD